MEDRVTYVISEGIADVRMVRADKMNALDLAMFKALIGTAEKLRAEPGLRAVVLSGEGRAFCAGLDTSRFGSFIEGNMSVLGQADIVERTYGKANTVQQAAWCWRELPVPVIAAVHGVAFGGGCQIALAADMRFAARDTRLSLMEIKWGIVPDMGGTPLLSRLVRDDVLRDLIYTGRIVAVEEALSLGLVTRICDDPRSEALAAARQIAAQNPFGIRAAKRMINALGVDPGPALLTESVEAKALIGSPNQLEAIRANREKRPARFADPA